MRKRILSSLLTVAMLLTMMPAAFAAGGDSAEVTVEPYVVVGQTTIEEQYFRVDQTTMYRFGVKLSSDSFQNGKELKISGSSIQTKNLADGAIVNDYEGIYDGNVTVSENCAYIPTWMTLQFNDHVKLNTYEVQISLTVDGKDYKYTYYVGINCEPSNKPKYVAQIGDVKYLSLKEAVDAAKDGETVTLIDDSPAGIDIRKKLTLDLNGHTITQSTKWTVGIFNDVTIKDSSNGKGRIVNASEDTSNIVHAAVLVQEKSETDKTCKLTIEGGVITSTQSENSYGVFSNVANEKYGPTILVKGGTIEGGKNGLSVTHDSDLVISGGTIIGGDFAVAGSGKRHNTKITISGGLLKQTNTLGSALFHPQNGELTITSGTLDGSNTGIEMRSGTLNISGGKISGGMGTPSSRANDNGSTTFNAAVAVAQHTTKHPITVNITGGTLTGGAAFYESDPNSIYADNAVQKPVVSIAGGSFGGQLYSADCQNFVSGGFFTENPDEYAAADKAAVASGRSDYPWTITDATESIVEPAVGEPKVDIPNTIAPADKDAVEAAAKAIDVQGLAAYASTVAQKSNVDEAAAKQALKDANIAGAETTETHVYAQAYLQITPKSYTAPKPDGSTPASLTMDITPMFRLVASTTDDPALIAVKNDKDISADAANAVVIPNTKPQKLDVTGTVHMVVPMPDGFVSKEGTIFVQHKNYEYAAVVSENQENKFIAEFDNPHGFSTFTFTMDSTSEAGLNGIGYAKLADAIADAKNGETVIVMKDDLSASMSGDSRTITVQNGTDKPITVTVNDKDYLLRIEEDNNSVEITYTRPSSSGSSSGSSNRTLTFNVNGGSELKKLTKAKGTTIDLSDYTPTRTGYTFAGWYSDKELTEKVTSVKLSENTTVYAKWTKNADETVAGFTDVKAGDWFAEEVQYVVDKGLMSGTSKTTFAPSATTTRGMIVAILHRLEKEPAAAASSFTDVKAGAYYEKAINWAAANEIVKGMSETIFAPDQAITREQMAAILYRYAQFKGYDMSKANKLDAYADAAQVSAYAVPAMQWANAENLITGKSATVLAPKGNATRAEVSSILMRFCENIAR